MAKDSPQRFRATICRQGPNPYVDVPQRASRTFANRARAGRINAEGRLNDTSIRATPVPVGKGRHRLYVNGGMRSAAGVGVGDTVSLELRAVGHNVVRPPDDVARALRKAEGATGAFEALSPSHRHELLRHVDDARTPQTRRRRMRQTIEHLLGRRTPGRSTGSDRPLWTCPECGNQFVNKNQYHSCGRYSLDGLFAAKPARIRELFVRFRAMVEACGPVRVIAYRDRAGFMVRVRFAGAVPKTRWLDVGLRFPRRVEHPRFHKTETLSPSAHIHLLRITSPEQLDDQVAGWVAEAYEVGRQQHLE